MSELAKRLTAHQTNKRFMIYDSMPLDDVLKIKTLSKSMIPDYAFQYDIDVTLRASFVHSSTEQVTSEFDTFDAKVIQAKRHIVEAVFGEFRQEFWKMRQCLQIHDVRGAMRYLHEFEEKMFSVNI
jgi:hypothetical protein